MQPHTARNVSVMGVSVMLPVAARQVRNQLITLKTPTQGLHTPRAPARTQTALAKLQENIAAGGVAGCPRQANTLQLILLRKTEKPCARPNGAHSGCSDLCPYSIQGGEHSLRLSELTANICVRFLISLRISIALCNEFESPSMRSPTRAICFSDGFGIQFD